VAGTGCNSKRAAGAFPLINPYWYDKYVGVPFVDGGRTIEGLDCYGLFRLIYQEQLGIDLPTYGETSALDLRAVAREISAGCDGEKWAVVEVPSAFDGVVMRLYDRSWIGHVGVAIDAKRMIHIEAGIDAAVVSLKHFTVRDRIAGFRRYKGTGE